MSKILNSLWFAPSCNVCSSAIGILFRLSQSPFILKDMYSTRTHATWSSFIILFCTYPLSNHILLFPSILSYSFLQLFYIICSQLLPFRCHLIMISPISISSYHTFFHFLVILPLSHSSICISSILLSSLLSISSAFHFRHSSLRSVGFLIKRLWAVQLSEFDSG